MIDESLLKSNFIGRDGFRWWIGQIPPESSHGGQINGAGWGNRFKVRIMGYHPYNTVELPNEDLPWAQCLLPTTSGTGAGNNATTVKVSPGDTVFGFFLDGDNAQIPVIMGCFGRTSQVPSGDYAGPFIPFTGYTGKVKKPNGTLKPDQSLEQNAKSQKSPRSVSPQQAEAIADDEISSFSAIGDKILLGNTVNNTIIGKISTKVGNAMNKDGIGITANINKFLALASQYGLELKPENVIWAFKNADLDQVNLNKFGTLNAEDQRVIALIGNVNSIKGNCATVSQISIKTAPLKKTAGNKTK